MRPPNGVVLPDELKWSEYDISPDRIIRTRFLGIAFEYGITFVAENIRDERTGPHAKVSIYFGEHRRLGYDALNLDKAEERGRLVNKCYKQLATNWQQGYSNVELQRDCDDFCDGLFELSLESGKIGALTPRAEWRTTMALEPYLPRQGGTFVYAPPKAGKSWLLYLWAMSLDAGCSALWVVPQRVPVLLVNLERPKQSVEARFWQVNRALGLPEDRQLTSWIHARGQSLTQVAPRIRSFLREHGDHYIMVDSLSRAGAGDLKDDVGANRACDTLNSLAPGWCCLGHSPRGDGSHIYGSVMFEAAADVMVEINTQRKGMDLGLGLQVTGANDLPPVPMLHFALEFTEEDGLVRVRASKPGEFAEVEGKERRSTPEMIHEYLLSNGLSMADTVADAIGRDRSTVSRTMHNDPELHSEKRGREVWYGMKGSR